MGNHIKFVWNDSYSASDKEIDEAHKHFFDVANAICDLSDKNAVSAEELIPRINELNDYIYSHFSSEEANIRKYDSSDDAELHIKEHDVFRDKVADYIKQAKNPSTNIKKLTDGIADFVEEWLLGHISQITKEITISKGKNR